MKLEVQLEGIGGKKKLAVELEREGPQYRILLDGKPVNGDAVEITPNTISVLLNGQSFEVHITETLAGHLKLQTGRHEFKAVVADRRSWRGHKQGALEAEGRQQIIAPMPGKLIRILVNAGDTVEVGDGLAVIEAMKMQNEIRSPKSGKVERLLVKEGQNVSAGEILAWVE